MLVAWPAQMRLSQPGGMWGRLGARVGGSVEGRWGSCELGPNMAISCLCDPEPRFPYLWKVE